MSNEEIIQRIQSGIDTTENLRKLYEQNRGLIKKVIRPFTQYEAEDDLMQESYLALEHAARHYNSAQSQFSTFFVNTLKRHIVRYLEDSGRLIRLPVYMEEEIHRYKETARDFQQSHGREPTDAETAGVMGVELARVRALRTFGQMPASLDAPACEDADDTLSDTIKGPVDVEEDITDKIYQEYQKRTLWEIVEKAVTAEELDTLISLFCHGLNMSQLAREQGKTPNQVRNMKSNALRKLRTGRARKELEERLEILDAQICRTGLTSFKLHGSSQVEHIAIRRAEIQRKYAD